jgi:hypothetical protein
MFIFAGRPPALAGVGLVDDDGERSPAVLVADLVQDERELLHRGDDDLLAAAQELPQVAASLGVADRGRHLGELLDGVAICLSSTRRSVTTMTESKTSACRRLQPDQLVRQPGDGVALAAAGRVLDQVAPPGAVFAGASASSLRTTSSWW